jgi:hypothetical protein
VRGCEKEKVVELTKVTCNSCGAALEIPPAANFVTCRYCKSQLEVKRTESTIFTEVLNRLDQRTAEMADDLDAIRRENEIERLDREWEMRRASLMTHHKNGSASEPSAVGGVIVMVVMGGFGILWTIGAVAMMSSGPPGGGPPAVFQCIFPLFGVAFVVIAIAGGIKSMTSAGTYNEEHRKYQQRREALLRQSDRSDT